MDRMFDGCKNLTSLDLSGWNTSNVNNMNSMFRYCSHLTSLDLSGWDLNRVIDMSVMFRYCTSLKRIRMVGCSEKTINKIKEKMPSGCTIVTE